MPPTIHTTTVVFAEPVLIAGLDGALTAGEYEVKIDIPAPPDTQTLADWAGAIRVQFEARTAHPDQHRTHQSLPLSALSSVTVRDARTGRNVLNLLTEAVLADPAIGRIMAERKLSKAALRDLLSAPAPDTPAPASGDAPPRPAERQERAAIQRAENEGMPVPTLPRPKAKKG